MKSDKEDCYRAKGGAVNEESKKAGEKAMKAKPYDAADSNVEKEAEEKKRGGRVHRKRGGAIEGKKERMHLGRPGRKSGGRVGSDKSPLTSAAHLSPVMGHRTDD